MTIPDKLLVTAVIPTRNRHQLVTHAVRSALRQTYRNLEVVVVIDGADPKTEESLSRLADSRLRVIALPESSGPAAARNIGVAAARGEWIAFLDDDDQWLPEKIELQMAIARKSRHPLPIVSCRFFAHTPERDYVWPRRLLSEGENVSDYLFRRRNIFQGEGFIATPTLLIKRELLMRMPLNGSLKKHEDWDWMIRVATLKGVRFEFSQKPLVIVRMGANHQGLSNSDDWRHSLDWIRERRKYVTPQAYAAFILTVVADQASRQATLAEYLTLPVESWRNGAPDLFHFLLYTGMAVLPRRARHNLRQLFKKRV
ncbi:MAG: glycosyltransferase family 2 protein [Candidatus Acidiferrum sp.]